MSSAHGSETQVDRIRSAISSLPAEPKLVGLVAFLVVVALTPRSEPAALLAQFTIAVVVAVASFVDWSAVARRLMLDIPLVVLAISYALFGRAPYTEVLGVQISEPGATVGLAILAKSVIGIVAVSALAASTSLVDTVSGLRRLGVPDWFCHSLALATRQLEVLRDDVTRLRTAVAVRTGSTRPTTALLVATRSLGPLFVRATDRADRLQLSAELRGRSASEPALVTLPTVRPPGLRAWALGQVPAALALAAVIAALLMGTAS